MKKNIIYIVVALAVIAVVIIKLKTNKETTIDRVNIVTGKQIGRAHV